MMVVLATLLLSSFASAFVDYGDALPVKYAVGNDISLDADQSYDQSLPLTITAQNPVLTIDYADEVAGVPFFEVVSLSGPTQIEVQYAEDFVALDYPGSDGPWTFGNELANTFRVETFNLTESGRVESYFVQGGQRWETIRLLTNTSITFAQIGMRATSDRLSTEEVPGKFATSNSLYNRIWDLGARVVQVACIDKGNAPATWDITPDGAFIRGQQTAQSDKGLSFSNYTLSFATKIVRGGTGWRVASGITPYGALFYLTSGYPENTTYLNTNRTLLPPNSLVFNYGYSLVNTSTLQTGWNQYLPLNQTIREGVWYNVITAISTQGYEVFLDGVKLVTVTLDEANFLASGSRQGSGSPTSGTWGFGPWNGQEIYVKDVKVTARNGTTLYANDMKSEATRAEYNVATLDTSVCLDGAKRDRLVWIGDFYHTPRVIAATTTRSDYVLGTIDYVFSFQKKTEPNKGFVPISPWLGTRPEYVDAFSNLYSGLIDYQDLFVTAIGTYYWMSGDAEGLKPYWKGIKDVVAARMEYVDPSSSLVAGDAAYYFLGPVNGTAVTALFAQALWSIIPIAEAYNDTATVALYSSTVSRLREAINKQLWKPSLGTYSLSLDAPSNYSLTDMAWTILSGTANSSQAESMIAKLPELRLGVGYKTYSSTADDPTAQLAPNVLGMLLEALFKANRDLGVQNLTVAQSLLDDFWSQMVTQNEYYSGASWEYLYPDGSPGIGLFTSLAHPWGAAPTYVMTEYVLGISATEPGYKSWRFEPPLGKLGLENANGTVPTPYGDIIASWTYAKDGFKGLVEANVPTGTAGSLVLPAGVDAVYEGKRYTVGTIPLAEGRRAHVEIYCPH